MIALLAALATASAGEWREPKPYLVPILNASAVSVNGDWVAIFAAGGAGGVRVRWSEAPHWLSHTRAVVVGMYGVPSGSLGAEMRAGSFVGPDWKHLQWQVGPDLFYGGYGDPDALDYWLPFAPGLDLHNVVTLKASRELHLVGEATPGWVFREERKQPAGVESVAPFDQLTLAAMAVIRAPFMRLTVGYSRQYSSVGVIEGIILSGAL